MPPYWRCSASNCSRRGSRNTGPCAVLTTTAAGMAVAIPVALLLKRTLLKGATPEHIELFGELGIDLDRLKTQAEEKKAEANRFLEWKQLADEVHQLVLPGAPRGDGRILLRRALHQHPLHRAHARLPDGAGLRFDMAVEMRKITLNIVMKLTSASPNSGKDSTNEPRPTTSAPKD